MNELQAHIEAQNSDSSMFTIVSDPAHWAEYGITTVAQYEHHMVAETYIDVYKSVHGIKPRWVDFEALSTEEISDMLDSICEMDRQENLSQEEYEAECVADYVPTPAPINNPFAAAFARA
jgi:hypothetical protein